MTDLIAVINTLNTLTWPGVVGLATVTVGIVGLAFAVVWWWRS